jgi:hypothetical protein
MKCIGVVLLGWTVAVHAALLQPPAAPPPVGGRLAGAVLLGEAALRTQDLPQDLSSSDRMRLAAYLERWNAFRTRQGVVAGSWDTWVRRERIEREIASVIEHPGIEQVAHAIAWGQGPYGVTTDSQQEVAWAETLVRDPANAVAAPFLYAFLASRYRMQFERADEDRPALERLAKKYKTMLDRVRNAGDGLFILLADDLDNRPTLSSTATRHPREYLPDT